MPSWHTEETSKLQVPSSLMQNYSATLPSLLGNHLGSNRTYAILEHIRHIMDLNRQALARS